MSRFFTADLHLGHKLAARLRGFGTDVDAHDRYVINKLNSRLIKKSKLWVLGDVGFSRRSLELIRELKTENRVLILGNHDVAKAELYLEYFKDVHGALKYKSYMLTHIPIHPQELLRFKANIHGHIHVGGTTQNIGGRHCNVGVEWNGYLPVPFEELEETYGNHTSTE